jgi:type I restriction enzyme S subunit
MRAESEERITQVALAECSLRQNQPGDVLIAMYGATIGKLGILEVPGTTNQAVCACTCFSGFSNRYLFLVLLAWRESFRASGEGGAQPNISKVKIVTTAIPVPPLAEQHRIVAKVDALMSICDAVEARLTTARDLHGQFAAAAVHHLDV